MGQPGMPPMFNNNMINMMGQPGMPFGAPGGMPGGMPFMPPDMMGNMGNFPMQMGGMGFPRGPMGMNFPGMMPFQQQPMMGNSWEDDLGEGYDDQEGLDNDLYY